MLEDFKEIKAIISVTLTPESLSDFRKILTKLNNPIYYNKKLYSHPSNKLGYKGPSSSNIWVQTIKEFKEILSLKDISLSEKQRRLQIAYAWLYNNPRRDFYVKKARV